MSTSSLYLIPEKDSTMTTISFKETINENTTRRNTLHLCTIACVPISSFPTSHDYLICSINSAPCALGQTLINNGCKQFISSHCSWRKRRSWCKTCIFFCWTTFKCSTTEVVRMQILTEGWKSFRIDRKVTLFQK